MAGRRAPSCYLHGAFTPLRELYAILPESRARGYKPPLLFHVRVPVRSLRRRRHERSEMNFLPDARLCASARRPDNARRCSQFKVTRLRAVIRR